MPNLEIGQATKCATCGRTKKPIGRDAGIAHNSFCAGDHPGEKGCPGYRQEPYPGDLWPGERRGEPLGHERSDAWLPIDAAPRDGSLAWLGWDAWDGRPAGVVLAWWSESGEIWQRLHVAPGHPAELRQVLRADYYQAVPLPAPPKEDA